jgi:hypothetical protein
MIETKQNDDLEYFLENIKDEAFGFYHEVT